MDSAFTIFLGLSSVLASPLSKRAVDNTQSSGTNPLLVSSVDFLGIQTSDNSCSHRDLGFTGKINGKWYAVFGDALWCASGVTDPADDVDGFHGMARDAVSEMTSDILKTHDLNLNGDTPVGHQTQFIPYNTEWGETQSYGFGGTSLCATNNTAQEGVVFYVVNANDKGLKGSGVAKVNVINGAPQVTERYGTNGYWWPTSSDPRYGDVAAYRDARSEYIYALGGAPTSQTGFVMGNYVYQVRVKASEAFELSKYEYWHGRSVGWSKTPLTDFNTETAVMWNVGQGQITWNAYYQCYIFVHATPGGNQVVLRTAPSPEGPWSSDIPVFSATLTSGGMMYAGVAHPYLDRTGRTLTITYTNFPNNIEAIKVTFQ